MYDDTVTIVKLQISEGFDRIAWGGLIASESYIYKSTMIFNLKSKLLDKLNWVFWPKTQAEWWIITIGDLFLPFQGRQMKFYETKLCKL